MRFFAKNAFFRKKGAYITSGWLNGPIFVFLLETDFFWKIYPTMMQKTVGILKKYTSFDFLAPFDVFVVPPPKGAFTNKKTKKCCFWPRFGSIMHIEFWFFLRNGNCFRNLVGCTHEEKEAFVEEKKISGRTYSFTGDMSDFFRKKHVFSLFWKKGKKCCFLPGGACEAKKNCFRHKLVFFEEYASRSF